MLFRGFNLITLIFREITEYQDNAHFFSRFINDYFEIFSFFSDKSLIFP